MKEMVVISGKGGTGKTSLTASFASLNGTSVIADCDVDASDLHLVLSPVIKSVEKTTVWLAGSAKTNVVLMRFAKLAVMDDNQCFRLTPFPARAAASASTSALKKPSTFRSGFAANGWSLIHATVRWCMHALR